MYCWCFMCGFNARIDSKFTEDDDIPCPDCKESGQPSGLCIGDEFPEEIAEDEPLKDYAP
jgi:hypothetical protein